MATGRSTARGGGDAESGHLSSEQASVLHQQAWLLRSIAVELRMTSISQQRSHTQRITNLLLGDPTNQIFESSQLTGGIANSLAAQTSVYKSDFDLVREGCRQVLVLLDLVDFSDRAMPALELTYFNQSAIEDAVTVCDTEVKAGPLLSNYLICMWRVSCDLTFTRLYMFVTIARAGLQLSHPPRSLQDPASNLHYCDVKRLHAVLLHELNSLQGVAAAGQREGVLEASVSAVAVLSRALFVTLHSVNVSPGFGSHTAILRSVE